MGQLQSEHSKVLKIYGAHAAVDLVPKHHQIPSVRINFKQSNCILR